MKACLTSLEVVEEVVSEAVQRLRKRIPHAKINVSIPEAFLMVPMDPLLIEQVIMNLLENAVIHSESKQAVDLVGYGFFGLRNLSCDRLRKRS